MSDAVAFMTGAKEPPQEAHGGLTTLRRPARPTSSRAPRAARVSSSPSPARRRRASRRWRRTCWRRSTAKRRDGRRWCRWTAITSTTRCWTSAASGRGRARRRLRRGGAGARPRADQGGGQGRGGAGLRPLARAGAGGGAAGAAVAFDRAGGGQLPAARPGALGSAGAVLRPDGVSRRADAGVAAAAARPLGRLWAGAGGGGGRVEANDMPNAAAVAERSRAADVVVENV